MQFWMVLNFMDQIIIVLPYSFIFLVTVLQTGFLKYQNLCVQKKYNLNAV